MTPSFEEVDAHVASRPLAQMNLPSAATICAAYKSARPVLLFVSGFIPPAWRGVLTALMTALDQACP